MSRNLIKSEEQFQSEWRYQPNPSFYDELMDASGKVRPHWQPLVDSLLSLGSEGLTSRWKEGRRLLHDHGVTYNVYDDPQSTDRPWPLDAIPMILSKKDWASIEAAVIQRATLLNAILRDLYGPQKLLRDRVLPSELIYPHPGFLRECSNAKLPGDTYLHLYGVDLARAPDGRWWVLADRTQTPSGAGYALENRLVASRVLPDVFETAHVHRLATFFQKYRDALRQLVPTQRENPRIVLLTAGPYNETYFEHAFLARYLGYTLVEGGDLTVRENRVYLKTLGGLLPVDVIFRRQDDSFCDPLELREDSMLGVPGLMQAVRSGTVAVANALGSGVMENAAPSAFMPSLCRHILGEDLKMPTVATWWCGQPAPFSYVTSHMNRLVIKQTFPRPDAAPIFGAKLSAAAKRNLLDRMLAAPDHYIAQEQVSLSTAPVWEDGRLQPRHFVLRVYAVASGDSYAVMPGGLTRVTNSLDSLVVSMQHGGGSKDTWVLTDERIPEFSLLRSKAIPLAVSRATFDLPSRVADNLFWLGRYVERVEAAVRIVRSVVRRLARESFVGEAGLLVGQRILTKLEYMHHEENTDAPLANSLEHEILQLIYDPSPRTSIGANIREIRRVAWLLRDRISADAWRILSRFEQQFSNPTVPPEALRISAALDMLDQAIITLSSFGGLVMESMTRGDGWRFLDIGRRLERATQMVQLLQYGLGFDPAIETGQLEMLLEMADSSLTYRSRYQTSMQANLVLDLLLVDEANPRSIIFQLARLREHVEQLPESRSLTRRPVEARLALSMLNQIQLAQVDELVQPDASGSCAALEALLSKLSVDLRHLSESLMRVYFSHSIPSRQLSTL